MPKKIDVIQQILLESNSYNTVEMMESLVNSPDQKDSVLAKLPLQPLYMAIKNLTPEQLAPQLKKFSKDQRIRFLDLDLWFKDTLDVESFNFWLKTYHLTEDQELVSEFTNSSEFTLFLKGVFNIWTFDIEDPRYPDHDNYFLTEDNLLLFEFHDNFEYVDEARGLIRALYSELGVEKAYAQLFKLTCDSFLIMQEEEYQAKNYRLAEVGFVDYFEALKMDAYFASKELLDQFILNYNLLTPNIEGMTLGQSLHNSTLTAFKGDHSFRQELEKISDIKRKEFLQINFIRLVNGTLAIENALKNGTLAMTRVGEKSCALVELGFCYTKDKLKPDFSIFEKFDFIDLYRIGNSLIGFTQKDLKKALHTSLFEDKDEFLGKNISEFLEASFDSPVKYVPFEGEFEKPRLVNDLETLSLWQERAKSIIEILPFAQNLFQTFKELTNSSKIQDHFYLNYNIDQIDFVAIMISSFANFALGNYRDGANSKMGLNLAEYKEFVSKLLNKSGKVDMDQPFGKKIKEFISKYGLQDVFLIETTIFEMLVEQIEGYDYQSLSDDDYKHVGGPIILNHQ